MRLKIVMMAAASGLLLAGAAAAQTTGVTGGGAPINNYQPSLVMNQLVQLEGVFPSQSGGGSTTSVIGQVHAFAGTYQAYGAPQANGQLLSIQQNQVLFAITGTTYGGDGQNSFALPNLAGTAAMGAGAGPGLTPRILGETVGSATNTMTLAQLPAHDHGLPGGGVTGTTGSGATPLGNMQPTLTLNYGININGFFPGQGGGGGGEPFLGEIGLFAGSYVPAGYVAAAGQLLSIQQNQALFAVLGTTYGGDGKQTFALPDLRGRVIVGAGQGQGLSPVTLGEAFGTENTFLTDANLPSHVHSLPGGGFTDPDGGALPFSNEQPSLGLNYLIALNGDFPPRDGAGDWSLDEPTLGEVVAFAGNYAPSGFAFAAGQLLSISQNTALFAILGTTYGGDGKTTFALPDLRGRTLIGAGGGFLEGEVLGEENHVLNVAELAPHDHSLPPGPGVPEPSIWGLLIAGFGLAGAALRRRTVPA